MKKHIPSPLIDGDDARKFMEEMFKVPTKEEIERITKQIRKALEVYDKHGEDII